MSQLRHPPLVARLLLRGLPALAAVASLVLLSETSAAQTSSGEATGIVLGVRGGVAWLRNARSLALTHIAKPGLRLEAMCSGGENWSWGAAFGGLATTDENYGVWSAQMRARYHWSDGTQGGTQWGVAAGLGVARDAPILHANLRSRGSATLLGSLAVDAQWQLSEKLWWGLELETEQWAAVNPALLHLGLLLRVGL